jgi:magnesium transporter
MVIMAGCAPLPAGLQLRHHDAIRVLNDRIATISAGDSGIHSYSKASPFLLVKKRLFWLLVLAALNFGVAAVVASFEETISQNLVLAGFIPLLAGMGGNIGAQASGLVISGTSSRDISPKDIFRVLWKEMFVSSSLAGILGCVASAMGYIRANEGSKPQIAATLGLSMFVIALISNFLGVLFPFGAIAVGIDPAVSSSPLITTVIDVLGISVYLVIARGILGL